MLGVVDKPVKLSSVQNSGNIFDGMAIDVVILAPGQHFLDGVEDEGELGRREGTCRPSTTSLRNY